MPLNILHHKSWNVYSKKNQERIARDEADERARDEARTKLLQEYDAAKRLASLQGKTPPPPPVELTEDHQHRRRKRARDEEFDNLHGDKAKRRRLPGEDETDRDIRLARADMEDSAFAKGKPHGKHDGYRTKGKPVDAPIIGEDGHINLFPMDAKTLRKAEENAKLLEQNERNNTMLNMRFDQAAGRDGFKEKPWYSNSTPGALSNTSLIARSNPTSQAPAHGDGPAKEDELMDLYRDPKDVWGKPDPARKQREIARQKILDPLSIIQAGVRKMNGPDEIAQHHLQKAQRKALEEELQRLQKKKARREAREMVLAKKASALADDDKDSLEGFSLDAPALAEEKDGDERRHRSQGKSHRHRRGQHSDERGHRESDESGRDRARHKHGEEHSYHRGKQHREERHHRADKVREHHKDYSDKEYRRREERAQNKRHESHREERH